MYNVTADSPYRVVPTIDNPSRSKYGNNPDLSVMTKEERKTFWETCRKRAERNKKKAEWIEYVFDIVSLVFSILQGCFHESRGSQTSHSP